MKEESLDPEMYCAEMWMIHHAAKYHICSLPPNHEGDCKCSCGSIHDLENECLY